MHSTKYVAQDSLELLPDDEQHRVVHRALLNFFHEYSPAPRRYLPNPQLVRPSSLAGRLHDKLPLAA